MVSIRAAGGVTVWWLKEPKWCRGHATGPSSRLQEVGDSISPPALAEQVTRDEVAAIRVARRAE